MKTFEGKEFHIFGGLMIELGALNQFFTSLQAPFAIKGALMPDAHTGYAMPIGGVILTEKEYIVPSWVGYDIGCGVCYVETTILASRARDVAQDFYTAIRDRIPVGFNHHSRAVSHMFPEGASTWLKRFYAEKDADLQLGTMGGNNHFIEVGVNSKDRVCFVIHSGSRGIGHDVAQHYMKIAGGGKAREGSYPLHTLSMAGKEYVKDMNFLLDWALKNRRVMLKLMEFAAGSVGLMGCIDWPTLINKTHNHAELTADGWIHRKGATQANDGERGVIPGNPEVGSFVVTGRGNSKSLCSSSHGVGRLGSRKQAKARLSLDDFRKDMSGIVADISPDRLDEAPRAYKSPKQVMAAQQDLIGIVDVVKPFICVKG